MIIAISSLYVVLSKINSQLILASACGAGIYLLYSRNQTAKKSGLQFLLALFCGVYFAPFTTTLIHYLLPIGMRISLCAGAVIAAAVSVGLIGFLIKVTRNPLKAYQYLKQQNKQSK